MANEGKREVTLVRADYQPTKAEREELITLPEGTTLEDIAKALMRSVDIRWTLRHSARNNGAWG